MLAGSARKLAAALALGLAAAAAVVALDAHGSPDRSGFTVVVASDGQSSTTDLSGPAGTSGPAAPLTEADAEPEPDHALTEADLDLLPSIAAERSRSQEQAADATDQLEAVRTARGEAVEQSSRDAERRALEAAIASATPRELGQMMAAERGWAGEQWSCLDSLWQRESNWQPTAENPSSGAYGIPQSLPGSKMATVAADWRTNPATQITWGLSYIGDRYGSPCGAWGHSQSVGWY